MKSYDHNDTQKYLYIFIKASGQYKTVSHVLKFEIIIG